MGNVWINPELDPEFEKAVAKVTIGKPMKSGDTIDLITYFVDVVVWGRIVEISFDPDHISESLDQYIEKINGQLKWIINKKTSFDDVIINDLHQIKNDNWLDEKELPLNRETFIARIHPVSIIFLKNAAFEIWFSGENIFLGHSIKLSVNSKRQIIGASVEG